jgi:hypothetical protein
MPNSVAPESREKEVKNRILPLILIIALLLSACSGGTVATTPTVPAPAAQATSTEVTQTASSRTQTTASPIVALTPTVTAPAAEAISASAAVTQTASPRAETTPSTGKANGGAPPTEAIAACTGKNAQATCEFTWQKGAETGVCEMVEGQMTCSPQREPPGKSAAQPGNSGPPQITPAGEKGAPTGSRVEGGKPSAEAVAACTGKSAQAACEFMWQKGAETGVCEAVQGQLACSPRRDPGVNPPPGAPRSQHGDAQDAPNGAAYNIEQTISDKAQGMTIAFDALAFLTGDLGSDSFFPPGKVADFWGFQYLRDNDPSQMGHAGDFLTSAAMNMLNTLTANQRSELVALAKSQVDSINEYGYKRFVLMDAFQRLLEGDLPTGTAGLREDAVKSYSGELYRLDGEISFARAQLMGKLIRDMDVNQRAYLDAMVGKGMLDWPRIEEPADIRDLDRDVKVAVMTYAADMYSWYAGSVDADVYFCPERHGTYFGSFYLKDSHAMSDPTYAIPTNLTGEMGENMLKTLTYDQAQLVTSLVNIQQPSLTGLVVVRKQVSTELRKFKDGSVADQATILGLMEEYGAYDGEFIYNMAVHFSEVGRSLTNNQKSQLLALRKEMLGDLMHPSGAYLYSQAIAMPEIPNTDFLFK